MSLPVVLSLALVVQAAPQESPRDPVDPADVAPSDQAQRFYDQGVELFRTAQFDAAARAFEQAYALVPEASLLYNISLAWEQAGELERALHALERYAADSPPADAEQVAPQIEGLRQRIAKGRSEVDATDGLLPVDDDGEVVRARASTDPGDRSGASVAAGKRERVFTPLSGALLGVGAAGIGAGIGLAVAAWDQGKSVSGTCALAEGDTYVCPEGASGAVGRSRGMAIGADVAFAVGGAALVAATVLLAVRGTRLRRESAATSVTAVVGRGARSAGLLLTHRF